LVSLKGSLWASGGYAITTKGRTKTGGTPSLPSLFVTLDGGTTFTSLPVQGGQGNLRAMVAAQYGSASSGSTDIYIGGDSFMTYVVQNANTISSQSTTSSAKASSAKAKPLSTSVQKVASAAIPTPWKASRTQIVQDDGNMPPTLVGGLGL